MAPPDPPTVPAVYPPAASPASRFPPPAPARPTPTHWPRAAALDYSERQAAFRVGYESLCNMIGLSGGAISQLFLGRFADHMKSLGLEGRAQWDPAFPLYGGVLLAGGLLWLFVHTRRAVAPAPPG